MSVKIDYSKDKLLDEFAIATLKDRYMVGDETSPQEAFARAAMAFAEMTHMLKDYMIMSVIFGLCLRHLYYLMAEQKEVYQLAVFKLCRRQSRRYNRPLYRKLFILWWWSWR